MTRAAIAADAAFGAALMRHRAQLVRYAKRLCRDADRAEDLASQAVANAWRARDGFIAGSNLQAWMAIIVRNLFISEQRRKRWDGGYIADIEGFEVAMPAAQEFAVELATLQRSLNRIPSQQASAVLSVALSGSYEAAADEFGVAIGTIKSRVCRGRAALAEMHA